MNNFLYHYGIKGQSWGVRRFQNEDGTLTEEGKRRYYDSLTSYQKRIYDDKMNDRQRREVQKKDVRRKNLGESYQGNDRGTSSAS